MNYTNLSFVCPCYNHHLYVNEFIQSLLSQTNPNWELIIVDDNSTDRTQEILKQFKDPRIKVFFNDFNRGINHNFNFCVQKAKSEIISFVASDDQLNCEYVETILDEFNKNQEIVACYTPLRHMNEKGKLLNSITPLPVSKKETDIFSYMFINENLLPSPGMAIKKTKLMSFLPLDIGLIQYSDWQMHFLILFQSKIKLLEKPLVQYRLSSKSACARSPNVISREDIETSKLMNTVLDLIGNNLKLFLKYFGNHPLIINNNIDELTIPFWLGKLALTSSIVAKQKWGLQTIMNFISNEKNVNLLHKLYGFSYKDYMEYASFIKTPNDLKVLPNKNSKIAIITKIKYKIWKHLNKQLKKKRVI